MYNKDKLDKLTVDFTEYETMLSAKYRKRKTYEFQDPCKLKAFIPGIIRSISVKKGQTVKRGELLLVLEAMKMKNNVLSPRDGKIKELKVLESQMVNKNEVLLEFEAE